MKVAILGAGGFVGARCVEFARLTGAADVVPVIRSLRGAARLARFGRVWSLGDAAREEVLTPLLRGCDAAVNLTIGSFGSMGETADAIWRACASAKVPILVHLSSAEVFGRAEDPNLHDDSPPIDGHWMRYARGKATAEERLRARFSDERVACIVLRPGLIWGPRSPWVEGPAMELLEGRAFLVQEGKGICNLLYVDNLVHSLFDIIRREGNVSGFFNVADVEQIQWRDYYAALANEVGIRFESIHQLPAGPFRESLGSRLEGLKQGAWATWLKAALNKNTKQRLKRWLASFQAPPLTSGPVPKPQPRITRAAWHLQNTAHKLPTAKFSAVFGHQDWIPFAEAMRRTGLWLRFAGYSYSTPIS